VRAILGASFALSNLPSITPARLDGEGVDACFGVSRLAVTQDAMRLCPKN
jgi:hypothetical protein